jgi:hypothetical protein
LPVEKNKKTAAAASSIQRPRTDGSLTIRAEILAYILASSAAEATALYSNTLFAKIALVLTFPSGDCIEFGELPSVCGRRRDVCQQQNSALTFSPRPV